MFTYNTIDEALEDLRAGKIILVTDDDNRENEGDFICAAEFATQTNVNFMATYGKGLICMPMSSEYTSRLGLSQMVKNNTDNHCTAFTVSIDYKDTTTGISAAERSITAMKCVEEGVKPQDFRRPGHMFPLEAKPGGVLERNVNVISSGYSICCFPRMVSCRPIDGLCENAAFLQLHSHRRNDRLLHQG